jgi:hypothetical protein
MDKGAGIHGFFQFANTAQAYKLIRFDKNNRI